MTLARAFATAARMLADRPARAALSCAAVGFAALVMFVELGFFNGINDSSAALARLLDCDLVVSHSRKTHLRTGEMFSRFQLLQVRDVAGVAAAVPLYTAGSAWWNPRDGHRNHVLLLGADLSDPMLSIPNRAANMAALRQPGSVLFDDASRPELGRVEAGQRVRIENSAARIVGFFHLGSNYTYEGNLLAGADTFRSISGQREDTVDLGLVRISPGEDAGTVRSRIRSKLGGSVIILTPREILDREVLRSIEYTPTGIVFALGLALAVLIGTAVCYQVLFNEVHDHLKQFAMLRALGHAPPALMQIVAAEGLMIGIAGCAAGIAGGKALYVWVAEATTIPMVLTPARAGVVCALIALSFCVAGWRAVHRARGADPAELF